MPIDDVLRELKAQGGELPFGEAGQLAVMRNLAPWRYEEVASAIRAFVPDTPQPKKMFYGRAPGPSTIAYGYVMFAQGDKAGAVPTYTFSTTTCTATQVPHGHILWTMRNMAQRMADVEYDVALINDVRVVGGADGAPVKQALGKHMDDEKSMDTDKPIVSFSFVAGGDTPFARRLSWNPVALAKKGKCGIVELNGGDATCGMYSTHTHGLAASKTARAQIVITFRCTRPENEKKRKRDVHA
jgi:hypothetical protein